jgi:hypothetical protein
MKITSTLIVTILFLPTWGGCKQENNLMETNSVFEIKLESQKIKLGQDVNITAQLKNSGSQNLWVNKRLLVNSAGSPAVMREVWVKVVGPDGKEVPFSSRVRAGEARPTDFGLLKPGEKVTKQFKLSNYFKLEAPGTYEVTAHYQDGTKEVPPTPGGAAHWKEQLSSAPAKFELLPAE